MRGSIPRIVLCVLVTSVVGVSSNDSASLAIEGDNSTLTSLIDDPNRSSTTYEETFKERYRRLIPYMTYYVNNNYAPGRFIPQPTVQPVRQQITTRPVTGTNFKISSNANNNYYIVEQPRAEQFIPSVQYDPTDLDNEDYFVPVRYDARYKYEDYQPQRYQQQQNQQQRNKYRTDSSVLPRQQSLYYVDTTPRPTYYVSSPTATAATTTTTSTTTTTTTTPSPAAYHVDSTPISSNYYLPSSPKSAYYAPLSSSRPAYYPVTTQKPAYGDLLIRKPTRPVGSESLVRYVQTETPEIIGYVRHRAQKPRPFGLPETYSTYSRQNPNFDLNHIVKSLQLSNQLPEELNADNIDSSIKTLVEILSILHEGELKPRDEVPTSFEEAKPLAPANAYQRYENGQSFEPIRTSLLLTSGSNAKYYESYGSRGPQNVVNEVKYDKPVKLKPINVTPHGYEITEDLSHDLPRVVSTKIASTTTTTEMTPIRPYSPAKSVTTLNSQNFPPDSVKYGATRGKPNVDYPAYSVIPKTNFDCKTQRYKGFFGDPDTGCQVWHYCDLNGGMSSFLCPNGTIFSQVALTCDWWFNVKCESTAQLYVLNERLYKYIIPVKPKFPEDFSGPEVDRYLELKFKEMELKMREKKLKKQQEKIKAKINTPTNDSIE